MWKRNLRPPLSTFLRRRLPSASPLSTGGSTSHASLSTTSPSSFRSSLSGDEEEYRAFPFRWCRFPVDLRFSGKTFCSEPARVVANRCWNCASVAQAEPFLACENCRCVQPVDPSVDYFQIFGLEKKYEIQEENLEGKYKSWQKKVHPDLVHSKSEKEREYAAEQSARVIDAYRTLFNPLSRAIYILKLEGVDVDEEETISEPELLAEIMDIRESVEEAADSQALSQIQAQIQEKLKHWSQSFATAYQSRNYEEACTSIRRMTYYENINGAIVKKL